MPVQRCQRDGKDGWRWGKGGKCFTGKGARAKAERQGRAVEASIASNIACTCGLTVNRTEVVPSNPLKADPTRTITLRRTFEREFRRRFNDLKRAIVDLVVAEDAFGIKQKPVNRLPTGNEDITFTAHYDPGPECLLSTENKETSDDDDTRTDAYLGGVIRSDVQGDSELPRGSRDTPESIEDIPGGRRETTETSREEELSNGPNGTKDTEGRTGADAHGNEQGHQPELPEAGRQDAQEIRDLVQGGGRHSQGHGEEPGQVLPDIRDHDPQRLSRKNRGTDKSDRGAEENSKQTVLRNGSNKGANSGVKGSIDYSNGPRRVTKNQRHEFSRVTNQRFAFRSNEEQLRLFQEWLRTEINGGITTVTPGNVDQAYWTRFIEEGYRKGAGRAFDDVRKPALRAGSQEQLSFFQGTRAEFLRQSFAQPETVQKIKLLAGRVFTDLQGVNQAMATQMNRVLAEGLAQGQNPRVIAKTLTETVDKIGVRRAGQIARTETIRAHAEGQLDAMEQLGVEEVGVMAEWDTAGDSRVCSLCQPMQGVVMTIKEARGLIPRHVDCRCSYVPANVGEDKKEKTRVNFTNPKTGEVEVKHLAQKRGKSAVEAARDRSIKAEIPKSQRNKRTLAEQKGRSSWVGADKTIAKKRPVSVLDEPATKTKSKPKIPIKKVSPKQVTPTKVTPVRLKPKITPPKNKIDEMVEKVLEGELSGAKARKILKKRSSIKTYQTRLDLRRKERALEIAREKELVEKTHLRRLKEDPSYRKQVREAKILEKEQLRKFQKESFTRDVNRYANEFSTESQRKTYRAAANSWGSTDPEGTAVKTVAEKLKKLGWDLEQKGKNGSWYGVSPEGIDTRIGDHLGFDAHDIDIVLSSPATKTRVETLVNEILNTFGESGISL